MKLLRVLLWMGLWGGWPGAGRAQPVPLIQTGSESEWSLPGHTSIQLTPNLLSPEQSFQHFYSHPSQRLTNTHLSLGFRPDYVWLYFRLQNNSTPKTLFFIQNRIDYHHLQVFRRSAGRVDTLAMTGDALPFANRPVSVNFFAVPIPLSAHEQVDILILLDKRHEQTSGDIRLFSAAGFLQYVRFDTAVTAFFLGVAGFIFLFNFFLWLSLRDTIHLLFMAHIATITLLVISILGYGFEFIWPFWTYSNSILVTLIPGLWATTNLFLMKKMLPLTPDTSRFSRATSGLAWFIFFISTVGGIITLLIPKPLPKTLLTIGEAMLTGWILVNALLIIAIFEEQLRKRNPVAQLYAVALSFTVLGSVSWTLTMLNLNNTGSYAINWMLPGFMLEQITLTFGLTLRYNRFKNQNTTLQLSLAQATNETNRQIIQTQDSERERIAQDMHDDLGGTLATIRQRMADLEQRTTDPATRRIVADLEPLLLKSGQDLRRIAHNLMPPELTRIGLRGAVEQLVRAIPAQPTRFEFVVGGFVHRLPLSVELNVYRIISELVQNVLKHAQASRASVQLIYQHEHQLTVTVEDNGIGMAPDNLANGQSDLINGIGMGLKNSKLRAAYIGATLHRETGAGGTFVLLHIPYAPPDDRVITRPDSSR